MKHQRLFILGAPKCGTTSMALWLSQHPAIAMSRIKEPHHYNTDMGNRTVTDRREYETLFDISAQTRVLAEASTWYLYSDAAVPNILADHPDAKFVAMTRDPVEMAISLYYHNRFKLHEPLETLAEAWAAQDARARGTGLPRDCVEPTFLQYAQACSLRNLVTRLQARVRPENLLVLRLEDMRSDPGAGYRAVLDLVGLPDDGRSDFPVQNEARRHRSRALGHLFRPLKKIKRKLGLRTRLNLMALNKVPLERKDVPAALRAEMTRTLADQAIPPDHAAVPRPQRSPA